MKNKKAQIPYIQEIFAIIIFIAFLSAVLPLFKQDCPKCNCPTCDCSQYQRELLKCQNDLENQEVIYVNNTLEVPVVKTVEKIRYEKFPISITYISFSLILSLSLTLLSFKIKLPEKLEEKLENIEKLITYVKYVSLGLTIVIFIKLLSILILLL